MGSLKLNTTFWLSTAFFLMHLCLYFVLASSKGSSGLFLRLSVPFWSHEPFNDWTGVKDGVAGGLVWYLALLWGHWGGTVNKWSDDRDLEILASVLDLVSILLCHLSMLGLPVEAYREHGLPLHCDWLTVLWVRSLACYLAVYKILLLSCFSCCLKLTGAPWNRFWVQWSMSTVLRWVSDPTAGPCGTEVCSDSCMHAESLPISLALQQLR